MKKSIRLFLIWLRRWLRTSKPTEWITSLTAIIGVLGTIIAGYILLSNGLFDAKRSELEIRRTELNIQNIKLEGEQKELLAKERLQNARIEENNRKLNESEMALDALKKEKAIMTAKAQQIIDEALKTVGTSSKTYIELSNRLDNAEKLRAEYDKRLADYTKRLDDDKKSRASAKTE